VRLPHCTAAVLHYSTNSSYCCCYILYNYTVYTTHADEALPLWAQHAGFELMHTWQPVQLYNSSKNTNKKNNNDVSSDVAPPSVELHTGTSLRYYGRFYRGGVRCALGPTGPKLKPPTAQYRCVYMHVTIHCIVLAVCRDGVIVAVDAQLL
jgi:hypothetical protein